VIEAEIVAEEEAAAEEPEPNSEDQPRDRAGDEDPERRPPAAATVDDPFVAPLRCTFRQQALSTGLWTNCPRFLSTDIFTPVNLRQSCRKERPFRPLS